MTVWLVALSTYGHDGAVPVYIECQKDKGIPVVETLQRGGMSSFVIFL